MRAAHGSKNLSSFLCLDRAESSLILTLVNFEIAFKIVSRCFHSEYCAFLGVNFLNSCNNVKPNSCCPQRAKPAYQTSCSSTSICWHEGRDERLRFWGTGNAHDWTLAGTLFVHFSCLNAHVWHHIYSLNTFLAVQPYVNGDADPTARVDLTKLKVRRGGLYSLLNSYMQQNRNKSNICNLLNSQEWKKTLKFLLFKSQISQISHFIDLQVQALRKYTKVYELQGIHPQSSKEELTSAVTRHWNQAVSLQHQLLTTSGGVHFPLPLSL